MALAVAAACGVTVAALARADSPAPAITGLEGHISRSPARAGSTDTAVVSAIPAEAIALTRRGPEERTVLWTRRGVRDPGIEGRAFG
jgi:hypothetical protein